MAESPAGFAGEHGCDARAARFDAVVLAGGRGERLGGRDKPGLRVGRHTLVESVVGAARDAGAQRVVVVGPERAGLGGGARVVFAREEPAGAGPVAALRAGLEQVAEPVVVLLAADLPFLRAWHVRWLVSALSQAGGAGSRSWRSAVHNRESVPPASVAAGVVMVDDGEREQWLVSCWHTEMLRDALARYQGQSLHGLMTSLELVRGRYSVVAGRVAPWVDCDTPEELAWARRLLELGIRDGTEDIQGERD